MLKHRLKYVWFVLMLLAFMGIFIHLRTDKPKQLKQNAYHQWAGSFVIQRGETAYIETAENTVLSEGQGYGMYIAAKAGQDKRGSQKEFDRLYQYYLDNRLSGSELMSWKQTFGKDDEIKRSGNNATDGDLYIAHALIEAAKAWPKDAEAYHTQARKILDDILFYNYNADLKILTVGNWATPETDAHNLMRTSDVMPKQFDDFYALTQDDAWLEIKESMLDKLVLVSDKYDTGLVPDFVWVSKSDVKAAEAEAVASEYDGHYSYNACRVPYHLAQSNDKKSQKVVKKMLNFFMDSNRITAGYSLDGIALNDYQSASFLAPIFYASKETSGYDKLVQQNKFIFLQHLEDQDYYEMALITMVALDTFAPAE